MKNWLFLLVSALLVILVGCGDNNKKEDKFVNDAHAYVITGKVIEIREDNVLLLEITKERGGYKKEDKVLVKYEELHVADHESPDASYTVEEPKLDDEIGVQFFTVDDSGKYEYDCIDVTTIYKTK